MGGGGILGGVGGVVHMFVPDCNQPEELSVFEGDRQVGRRKRGLCVWGGLHACMHGVVVMV